MTAAAGAALGPDEVLGLARLAERLALATAETVRGRRRLGLREVDTKTSPTDMVTELDRMAEHVIVEGILAARPDDTIVGEEGAEHDGDTGIAWYIDPVDGTTNLLYDLPGWGTSIAACDAAGPLVAAVAVPTWGELFSAVRGRGAYVNGRPLSVSGATELATSLVATGFGYQRSRREREGERIASVLPAVRDIRRMGAAAVDLCLVGAGRVDAYFEEGLKPWDLHGGELVAREAGAVITDLEGGPVRPASVVAAAPGVHAELVRLLAADRARAAEGAP